MGLQESYESFLAVEIYDILMVTQNMIRFERLMQGFDNLFYYTFQEGPKLKILYMNTIKSEYGISIDHTYHIIKKTIQ